MTICPKCNIYDVDPTSKEGWCIKCTAFALKQPSSMMAALLAASEKELALRKTFNAEADALLSKTGARLNTKAIEDAKAEYMKSLVTLHHEVRDWVMGVRKDEVQS